MALTTVIAYDVSEDGRRARLAALLQRYGDRIQFSVYLCRLDEDDLNQLVQAAERIINLNTDSLYVLRQCPTCWERMDCRGQSRPPERVLYWLAF
ncbi:CRISPR-associated endonuclease Cas2 [Micropruina sp.]|uniref:CRISPR-associated endonuclease Cas2 n=1 Tax=Micropruina sp. TaxID=2737536 RepID=UPI0039E5B422